MKEMKITIKEIAQQAGVSIATVSHVINGTRYVRPELVEKVEAIMKSTGYIEKVSYKEKKLKVGRASTIVVIVSNLESTVYQKMITCLKRLTSEKRYKFQVMISNDDIQEEQNILMDIMNDKKVAGILLVPVGNDISQYKMLQQGKIPFVFIERKINGEKVDSVVFTDRDAIYKGTNYLIECGHKNLLLLSEKTDSTTRQERTKGYLKALEKNSLNVNDAKIVNVELMNDEDECESSIRRALDKLHPTAVIASGNRITLYLLKCISNMGLSCPQDISVIGFGDNEWSELTQPPLTILERNVKKLSTLAVEILFEKIEYGKVLTQERLADVNLKIRKSTRRLDNGPYGDGAVLPEQIILSAEEKKQLKIRKYRVAILFHYTGTAWAELHERGIRDGLEQFGINIISVMDAHFDAELQNAQIEGILLQKPDATIAIPTDDKETAEKFRELSEVTKLVFLSNVPESMGQSNYASCVSVNEFENGSNIGRLIGEYYKGIKAKIGLINHGATFYGTRVRDAECEHVLKELYPDVEIVTIRCFGKIDNAYEVCKDILKEHPDINGLYVSWDQPALRVIKALENIGRLDVDVFTTDLDYEIAKQMEKGIVKGMSTQRPYEQGKAAALVVAKALVSEYVPKYVGAQPYTVTGKNLQRAWKEIFHENMPQ